MILNDFEGYSAGPGNQLIFPCAVERYRMAQLMWSSEACTNTSCADIPAFDGSVHPNDRGK